MATFTWTPDYNATKTFRANVTEVKFGDGYSQRQQNGLNAVAEDWSLTFTNRSQAEADAIDAFLTARGGIESFDFTPPNAGSSIKVLCRSGNWTKSIQRGNWYSISVKFEQVFEP